jgi:hypothetical protein
VRAEKGGADFSDQQEKDVHFSEPPEDVDVLAVCMPACACPSAFTAALNSSFVLTNDLTIERN